MIQQIVPFYQCNVTSFAYLPPSVNRSVQIFPLKKKIERVHNFFFISNLEFWSDLNLKLINGCLMFVD